MILNRYYLIQEDEIRFNQFFPAWADWLNRLVVVLLVGGLVFLVVLVLLATSPETQITGYMPEQPIEYSHSLHAGELDIDCRYCHVSVERSAAASVPSTNICMNCHHTIKVDSSLLILLHSSHITGLPVEWVRIHNLPDFAYFNHSAHVNNGIGCASCHGRVDRMQGSSVFQSEPLTMGWCLDCHRAPENHLRPLDKITEMDWELSPTEQLKQGLELIEDYNVKPSTDCSTCHR
jgi:hypothetical protein